MRRFADDLGWTPTSRAQLRSPARCPEHVPATQPRGIHGDGEDPGWSWTCCAQHLATLFALIFRCFFVGGVSIATIAMAYNTKARTRQGLPHKTKGCCSMHCYTRLGAMVPVLVRQSWSVAGAMCEQVRNRSHSSSRRQHNCDNPTSQRFHAIF